jgi:hypothetical protein
MNATIILIAFSQISAAGEVLQDTAVEFDFVQNFT